MASRRALSGWGRTGVVRPAVVRPGPDEDLAAVIAAMPAGIARGHGRAYGDAALHADHVLDLTGRRRIEAFDPGTGRLTAQAGLRLADLIATVLPQGWFPPVVPGTAQVSLGGMVAADVHGKNHHGTGGIGVWVDALTLHGPDGIARTLRPGEPAFDATIGGMGLTGVIGSVSLQLARVPGGRIRQQTLPARGLAAALDTLEASADWPYCVAWIDCLAGGRDAGRSVIYRGRHAPGAATPPRRRLSIPFDAPGGLLNRWSVRAFNAAYWRAAREGDAVIDLWPFFFPLDAIGGWNRLYGRRGFHQHQSVIPMSAARAALPRMLALVREAGLGSFLAVLKLLGDGTTPDRPGRRPGPLSFPMRGATLALDFPNTKAALRLMTALDRVVAEHGGRLYLAKDSRQAPSMLRPYDLAAFEAARAATDPQRRFGSLLSDRLGL